MQSLPPSQALMTAWRDGCLMDAVAWHLGVAWPALLVTEVSLPSLSDASGPVPVTWPRLLSSHRQHLPCAIHLQRLSILLVSPREVSRVFRYCLQDVLEPLFVQVWLKRPCDWELSNCPGAELLTTDTPHSFKPKINWANIPPLFCYIQNPIGFSLHLQFLC